MNRNLLFSTILLLATACNTDRYEYTEPSHQNTNEVSIALGNNVGSRTELDPNDNTKVRWSLGDQVALWAQGASSGSDILSAVKFELKYYSTSYDIAEFSTPTANIAPMSSWEGDTNYYYRAVYPYPTTISPDSDEVSWNIPAAQSGEYEGAYDLRVAEPTSNAVSALNSSTLTSCDLSFSSIMHILRITIPAGYNDLGEKISTLMVKMPYDAVGDVTISSSDLTSTPTLSNSTSNISINLANAIEAGEGDEIYLFIMPEEGVTGDIEISALGENGAVAKTTTIALEDHTFAAGHITPVGATIGVAVPSTTLIFSVDHTKLGEAVETLTVTAASGVVFNSSDSSEKNVATLKIADGESILIYESTTDIDEKVKTAGLTISYESSNALIEGQTYSFASFNGGAKNNIALATPYLFEEDFSSINVSSNTFLNSTSASGTSGSTSTITATNLSTYGLSDWCASRVGISTSKSVGIACYEYGSDTSVFSDGSSTKYNGRIDSPKLSNLKSGKSPTVSITFSYGGYKAESGSNAGTPQFQYGWFKESSESSFTYKTSTTGVENVESGSSWMSQGTNGSFTNFPYSVGPVVSGTVTNSFFIDDCTNLTRLTWVATCTRSVPSGGSGLSKVYQYGNYWLYLDNVTVTIVE